ncbi:DUF1800 domain-containing protein [Pseudorhodobacter sp. E13]|uniref:DUF1800 domain-containing protein n=1 Tax=Pseudorhodobacter sp. E13 TaxID=2487931 RepID=UPI000F8F11D7|nr:DUF1800 domain-containing protein [Pseudorhodobacter sp. E13]RUS65020.1 DUF1800 domain-containing protein [Pseudorhodobacter sp. E13]
MTAAIDPCFRQTDTLPDVWKPLLKWRRKHGFDPFLSERRFGCGLSPVVAPPQSVDQILVSLGRPDPVERRFPIETFPAFFDRLKLRRQYGNIRLAAAGTPIEVQARVELQAIAARARDSQIKWLLQHMLRRTWTKNGFRERLSFFWGDHFTALGKTGAGSRGMSTYIESAIRPNIAGRFGDLLVAAVTNPIMLQYLDQNFSVGPNSMDARQSTGQSRGLNENLAREVLELHTLGVDGPYTQTDVSELARLFTGLTFSFEKGFIFKSSFSEPGTKTVLGVAFGGAGAGTLNDVKALLHMLALHPATARHLSEKLATHFLGDGYPSDLADQMAARYLETGGYLLEVYRTMLSHPSAWDKDRGKAKNPFDFVSSAMRALAISPKIASEFPTKKIQMTLMHPMALMGQPWEEPTGPDGWSEASEAWITPQGLAARLQWGMAIPQVFCPELPDADSFAAAALGPEVAPSLRTIVAGAENKWSGIGLVLASPEFQTM